MYNAARYVRETIESVFAQTFRDWELIIVDDGSRDASLATAKSLATDPRVRVVSQANRGVSLARNHGFSLSSGRFVGFLDADDVWLPENLQRKVAWLETHPECGLVHSDVEAIDSESRATGRTWAGETGWVLERLLLWQGDPIPSVASNALFHRRVLEAVRAFDSAFSTAADQDLKFRVAARYQVCRIPEILVRYRLHGDNMHRDVSLMERDHRRVYRRAAELGLFPNRAFQRRCLSNLYLILAGSFWHTNQPSKALWYAARCLLASPGGARLVARKAYQLLMRGRSQ